MVVWRVSGHSLLAGRSVLLSGSPFIVVGVASREFRALGGDRGLGGDFWIPLNMQPVVQPGGDRRRSPSASMLRVMGRLQTGVSIERVQAEARVVHRQLPEEIARPDSSIHVVRGSRGFGDNLERQYGTPLRLLTAAVGMLLLVACANVASLLMARGGARQREMAVRQALGSGRMRLVRQCLVESLLLAGLGGALGLGLAAAGARGLVVMAAPAATAAIDLSLDQNILLFTLAASFTAAILSGLAPALHSSRVAIDSALKSASRTATASRSWRLLNRGLVAIQVALSLSCWPPGPCNSRGASTACTPLIPALTANT
jgi:hypothetical protein